MSYPNTHGENESPHCSLSDDSMSDFYGQLEIEELEKKRTHQMSGQHFRVQLPSSLFIVPLKHKEMEEHKQSSDII